MLQAPVPICSPLFFLALLTLLLTSGCASTWDGDEKSPYYQVPVGSILHIRQKIAIPLGHTRVHPQLGGKPEGHNQFIANCTLEVRRLDNEAVQYVEPGDYRIEQVQRLVKEIAELAPLRIAALGDWLASEDDGGTTWVYEGYRLWLSGPDPNLMRLTCFGAYASPERAMPPSIREIRTALGENMELELAVPR